MAEIVDYKHVGIFCTDLAAACTLYKEVLGFQIDKTIQMGPDGYCWKVAFLSLGGVKLEFLQQPDTSQIVATAQATNNHIAFLVDDLEELVADIFSKTEQFVFESGGILDLENSHAGKAVFLDILNGFTEKTPGDATNVKLQFMRGPNGERIELIQEAY